MVIRLYSKDEMEEEIRNILIMNEINAEETKISKVSSQLYRSQKRNNSGNIFFNIDSLPNKIKWLRLCNFSKEEIDEYLRKYLQIFFLEELEFVKCFFVLKILKKEFLQIFNCEKMQEVSICNLNSEELYSKLCHQKYLSETTQIFPYKTLVNLNYYKKYKTTKIELMNKYSLNKYVKNMLTILKPKKARMDSMEKLLIEYYRNQGLSSKKTYLLIRKLNYNELLKLTKTLNISEENNFQK